MGHRFGIHQGGKSGAAHRQAPRKNRRIHGAFRIAALPHPSAVLPAFKKLKDELQRGINDSALCATDRYDLYSRLERIPKYNEVCHGNFIPSKVIISAETGKPYIIDWFHATQGNAAADAALTYLLLRMRSRHDLAEQYLTLFCEKSGIEPPYIRRWMPLVAASQTVAANARTRTVLQQWIDAPEGEWETEGNNA